MELKRDNKIKLTRMANNTYEVTNPVGGVFLTSDQEYFIYFKNVNFKEGYLEGRYLGEASENLIDDRCKDVEFKDGEFVMDGVVIKTARMVAVDNKKKTVVVIESE